MHDLMLNATFVLLRLAGFALRMVVSFLGAMFEFVVQEALLGIAEWVVKAPFRLWTACKSLALRYGVRGVPNPKTTADVNPRRVPIIVQTLCYYLKEAGIVSLPMLLLLSFLVGPEKVVAFVSKLPSKNQQPVPIRKA